MRRLLDHLRLLVAPTPDADTARPIHRDDSVLSRVVALLGFPIIVLLQLPFVAAEARGIFAAAIACILVVNAIGFLASRRRSPRWLEMVLPNVAIIAIWLMAATSGGVTGAFAVGLLIPLIWFVAYAERGDVAIAISVTATCLLLPAERLLPALPDQGSPWLRVAFMVLVVIILASVRPLVLQLRTSAWRAQRAQDSLRASHATLAHDLRTPLTAICALATLTQQRLEFDEQDAAREAIADYAARIAELGWSAESIIEGVLELSRTGELLPAVEEVALSQIVRQVAGSVPGVELELRALPGVVVAHRSSLERLLRNLFDNAARHGARGTEDPPVRVIVSGTTTPTSWELSVSDDGPGFGPDEVPTLFEPWRRGARTAPGGHGLGLAIVAAIVEQHGGSITARNLDPCGARVTFTMSHTPPVASSHGSHAQVE